MKTCPICKSPYQGNVKQCNRCGLNLDWVKWRMEGLMAVGSALVLIALAFYLSSVTGYNPLISPGTIYHPYAGLGNLVGIIAVILLIAGLASAIVYDLKISKHSHRTGSSAQSATVVSGKQVKYCRYCGQQIAMEVSFCEKCGNKLV